jgi:hypothetical protein
MVSTLCVEALWFKRYGSSAMVSTLCFQALWLKRYGFNTLLGSAMASTLCLTKRAMVSALEPVRSEKPGFKPLLSNGSTYAATPRAAGAAAEGGGG